MKRFVIRNYGPSRQFQMGPNQICLAHDHAIETDDEDLAKDLGGEDSVHVVDRGPQTVQVVKDNPNPDSDPDPDPDAVSYTEMTVPELRDLAKDRQLDVKKLKKDEIIAVLEEYDAQENDEDTAPEE